MTRTLALIALLATPAAAQDRADLEAEMFGGDAADAPSAAPIDREAEMFGGEVSPSPRVDGESGAMPSDRQIEAMLDEAYDPLTLGARFGLRFDLSNYGDAYDDAEQAPAELSSPLLLDVYLDGRPSDRVRAFVGARLQQDIITAGDFFDLPLVQLDEAWLKFDVGRAVFFTVGKQRIKWGAARFWNPTDFLNRARLDPLSVIDLRLGAPLVKVHVPVESIGANLYAIALLDGATAPEDIGGALRMEWVLGTSEVSASVVGGYEAPIRIGADISAGLGPLEVRAEAAVTRDEAAGRWVGTWDPDSLSDFLTFESRGEDWIPQAVASVEWGIPYGDDDTLYVTGEYFFNEGGYDDGELTTWLAGTGDLEPLYTGRHYAGLNVAILAPGDLDDHTFLISALSNLSDGSVFARFDHQMAVLTRLRVSTYIGAGFGDGEFALDGLAPSFTLGADTRTTAATGTTIVAGPKLTAGVWLTVDI